MDIGATATMPIGRYADYMDYSIGGSTRLTVTGPADRWLFGLQVGGSWLHSIDPYSEMLASFHMILDAGYRIPMGTGGFSLIPRVSGGMIVHLASGDFNTLEDVSRAFYFDQYYGVQLELSYEPRLFDDSRSALGFYLAPNFFIFPNQENEWGLAAGVTTGLRIRFRSPSAQTATEDQ